jgi:oligopeptide/dipeptide ABC transporter ATP-binding protein
VDDVSFDIRKGEILGIGGESGCGKSTLGKTILRLHEKTDGQVFYDDRIARALALNPEFVVCDEAVSALDVSVQAQILNLLLDLREKHDLTYMFIAHDLAVVEYISTRIVVMSLGKIIEVADKNELVTHHNHPYSKALFNAFPLTDPHKREGKKKIVMGDVPSPVNPPSGCHFNPRCPFAMDICREQYPELKEVAPGHLSACHLNH